ncbi:MAG: OmpA family protein [Chitinophagales bacterium]|nr:OmpA family protein [Chitinophagales bacterium]
MKNHLSRILLTILFLATVQVMAPAQDNGKKEDKAHAREAKAKMKEALREEKRKEKEALKLDKALAKDAKQKMRLAENEAKETAKANSEGLSWKDYREAGDELFYKGYYYDAIPYYQRGAELKPDKICLPCKIAESYHLTRDYQKAEDWFQKVLAIDSTKNKYPLTRFFYAMNIKSQGRYKEAIRELNKFMGQNRKKKKTKSKKSDPIDEYLRLARRERLGAEQGQAMADTFTMSKNNIKRLDDVFNKDGFETAPYYVDGQQFVYTQMPADIFTSKKSANLGSQRGKIYAARDISGFWRSDGEISGNVNKGELHVMDPAYSTDGKRIYYSKCDNNGKPGMLCKIYYSEISVRGWTEGVELGPEINVEGYSSMQPNLSLDEDSNEVLYFVSDRPGSRGGFDIWYSVKVDDGSFKRARNAGGIINTRQNEVTPFFDSNKKYLYFSSNGHANIGGLDVFKALRNDYGGWERPVNLQMPINSAADDWHFVLNKESFKGLFASNRASGNSAYGETCCEDIYMISYAEPVFAVQGKVFEEYDGRREKSINGFVTLFNSTNDSMVGSYSMIGKENFYFKLEANKNYFFVTTKEGFGDLIYEFNTKNLRFSDTLEIDLVLIREDAEVDWSGTLIGTVFFEYDKFQLKREAVFTMDSVVSFIKLHPEYLYEAGGHTDNKGTDEYNQKLSLERALAVRKYILSKGVEDKKIKAVGYGESKPLAPNELPDGSENPKGREMNRRVEFKVVEKVKLP